MTKQQSKRPLKAVKKDSTLNYLTDVVINRITNGDLDKQTSNFQVSFNKILSETHKKEVFQILEFPTFVNVGHLENLRDALLEIVPPSMSNSIDIQILQYDVPNQISVSDRKMTRIRNSVEQIYSMQKMRIENTERLMKENNAPTHITLEDLQFAKEKLKRRKRLKFSFKQVRDHKLSGGTYMNSYVFLELTAATVEQLNVASEILKDLLAKGVDGPDGVPEPYVYEQITTELYDYIKRFGVASLVQPLKKKEDMLPYMSITSNVSVIDESFKPGIIRSVQPKIYAGHLLGNNYMYHFNFTGSTDASNMLLLADSGSGKTIEVMTMMLWALDDKKQHIIINDYKGGEWTEFAKLCDNRAFLSFNTGNPSFVNTYKVPDYKLLGFRSPRDAYQMSAHITEQILVALVNPAPMDLSVTEAICADIVFEVYSNHNVDPLFPATYHGAENIRFAEDTWNAIETVTASQEAVAKKYQDVDKNRVRNALARYFDHRGDKRGLFEVEVDLEKALRAKLLIIDFGMQTTGGAATRTENEYRCWMLQKFFVTSVYCGIQKMNREYSIEVHEEVAQQFKDSLTCEHLCRDITGNRSFNKTNILLTNTLGPLLNPTVNQESIDPIKENINIFMLGRCNASVAQDFITYIGRPEFTETALKVSQQVNPEYEHAFMLYHKTGEMKGSVVLKSQLPKSVFKTIMVSRDVDTSGKLVQTN